MRAWKVTGRSFNNDPIAIIVKARTHQAAQYKASRGQVSIPRIDSVALYQTPEEIEADRLKCIAANA